MSVVEDTPAPFIERGQPGYRATMLALFLGAFATFALLYCVQPMMPIFSAAFGLNAASGSLVLSVTTAMLALGLLITGPLSDAFGRKGIMSVALLAAAVFMLLAACMPTWSGVLVMRALCGLALSGLCAVGMTYLSEEVAPRFVGVSMGLYIGGSAIGGMAGRLIFTFGFFAAHSVASSWVGRRAEHARGQASSLYLFFYYLGSSLAGTLGGTFWHHGGWPAVTAFIAALLAVALLAALRLQRLDELNQAPGDQI